MLQLTKHGLVSLNQHFKEQLKCALSSLGGSPWEDGRLKLRQEKNITAAQLEHYARRRWDSVLHFMVKKEMLKVGGDEFM